MDKRDNILTPSAIETERVVLGSIFVDPDKIFQVTEILPPANGIWFYLEAHRLIYDSMMTLLERHDPIDMQTVTDTLHRRGQLEKVGGSVYIAELMECVTTTANISHHAGIVREKALYRSVINVGTSITASAYEQSSLSDILSNAHESMMQIANAQSSSSFSSLHDLMIQAIRHAEAPRNHHLTGIHTGFHELNTITNGFQNSNLIILAARPSQGKSALALQFAMTAAAIPNSQTVVFFSLEMSKDELGDRVLCSEARVDSTRMRQGLLNSSEWGQLMEAGDQLGRLPILIDDSPSLSILDIRSRTKRLQMEHGISMILVDYLQLLNSSKRKENRQQEVSEISRDLKILAKEVNVPVIALSQLSRDIENRDPPIPRLSDLRDSGSIEQDADVVLFISRDKKEDSLAKLTISKQRNGPTGEVDLMFSKKFARFDEIENNNRQRHII